MKKIKAIDFYQKWIETVVERKSDLLGLWRENTKFTNYIKGRDDSVVSQIGKKLELLTYEKDYYAIDTIFYKEEDRVPGLKQGQFWFRDVRIAFEHENNFNSGLYQELAHLMITNCDLKVLVAYPPYDTPTEMLNSLHKIVKGNRNSKSTSDLENFLIIFGYENQFEWEGFIYNEVAWKQIR